MTGRFSFFFFFTAPAPTEIYTLSLHDALPIFGEAEAHGDLARLDKLSSERQALLSELSSAAGLDRKSTRLNSSHVAISYAVFCLKKKKKKNKIYHFYY